MSKPNPHYKAHLFICTHSRDKGESCGEKGSADLRDTVKKACKKFPGTRVNAAGCLGQCERGIASVLYSSDPVPPRWFLELKADDSEKLIAVVKKHMSEHE